MSLQQTIGLLLQHTSFISGQEKSRKSTVLCSMNMGCTQEYALRVSNWLDVLRTLQDLVELWNIFKGETLLAAKDCTGERPRSRTGFASVKTLGNAERSRSVKLDGNRNRYTALLRRNRALLNIQGEVCLGSFSGSQKPFMIFGLPIEPRRSSAPSLPLG